MGKRLTPEEKESILAEYRQTGNFSAVARDFHVSVTAVRSAVRQARETEQTREDNAQALREEQARRLVGLYLDELCRPEKIAAAPVNQLASALGTVLDKLVRGGDGGKKTVALTLRDVPEEWLH